MEWLRAIWLRGSYPLPLDIPLGFDISAPCFKLPGVGVPGGRYPDTVAVYRFIVIEEKAPLRVFPR